MNIRTGQTAYENILSLDLDNNPVTGATFDSVLYLNNTIYTGSTPSYSLTDSTRGIFTFSWSADTIGDYQMYTKNNMTDVIFVSNTVYIRPDSEFEQNIFIGL